MEGGVILSHCLIGHCFICGAGVTDARGCSSSTWGQHRHSHPVKSAALAHAECMWQLQQLEGGWRAGWRGGWMELEGDRGSDRRLWQMQRVEASGARLQQSAFGGLTCLAPADIGFEARLQPHPVKGVITSAWLFDSQR